ncbi:hypothetical protein GCM10009555_064120 [Acrocarpospora macrocephala]|uniref:Uncharacterized protein n=1 Tax=Acrocarpospora macrocephala TaxID=150177 RepID=A0A5M3WL65_9ACTN|nr:hypothetical protein [Acrocarpospora macrocephala]GES07653.1 hypothetical protein Amac_012480 [Acrocarpospora macrocephala]
MEISIPIVLILGAVVLLAWRYLRLSLWQAVACTLFGFLLAATAAAPTIRTAVNAALRWLTNL